MQFGMLWHYNNIIEYIIGILAFNHINVIIKIIINVIQS